MFYHFLFSSCKQYFHHDTAKIPLLAKTVHCCGMVLAEVYNIRANILYHCPVISLIYVVCLSFIGYIDKSIIACD